MPEANNHYEFVYQTAKAGTPIYARADTFPYRLVRWPTTDLAAIKEAMEAYPDAAFIADPTPRDGVPAFTLNWQLSSLRQDDKAVATLWRVNPKTEVAVLENVALGERLVPVFPSDNPLVPSWGHCCCSLGLSRPHRSGHPCFPLDVVVEGDPFLVHTLLAGVPGIAWRRVVDGKLLPLLKGVLTASPLAVWVSVSQSVHRGHPLW